MHKVECAALWAATWHNEQGEPAAKVEIPQTVNQPLAVH